MTALPFPVIDPVALQLGPILIRWYALAYVAGIVIGWWLARRLLLQEALFGTRQPPSLRDLDDLIFWIAIGIVLGGRLAFVLFYNLPYYLENPIEIPQVWRGGMAFHGGAAGLALATYLFARARGFSFLTMMDVVAAVAPIGIFFGRIANFVNDELWGRVTDVPWAVAFPRGGFLPRHPSQLYEAALEGVVLFAVLMWLVHRRRALAAPGVVSGVFVAGYGLARFVVEFYREPDAQLGYLAFGLTMGQYLSLPMILAGLLIVLWVKRRVSA
jgi:phosphatidylglycerol:prolipoprotein diacylglycerol transferase